MLGCQCASWCPSRLPYKRVITQKPAGLRGSGLQDECAPEILRCALDDKTLAVTPSFHSGQALRAPEILRCAQDDSEHFVILSAVKDLSPTYRVSPVIRR